MLCDFFLGGGGGARDSASSSDDHHPPLMNFILPASFLMSTQNSTAVIISYVNASISRIDPGDLDCTDLESRWYC